MNPFQILLDAPIGKAKSRIQIAAIGSYTDDRWGDFSVTPADVSAWQANLVHLPGQQALVDFEHRSEKSPRDSVAAGWLTGLTLEDDGRVMGDVTWTPKGRKAVKAGRYKFVSPAFGEHVNEFGETFPNTLVSVGLTNKPVLHMPAITLSAKEGTWRLLDEEQPKPKKRKKNKPKKMDAQRVQNFAVPGPAPVRTLEQQAADEGKVLLDQAEVRELQQARTDRDSDRFTVAFDNAVRARKVSPGEREGLQRLYQLDAVTTLESLAMRAPILPDAAERGEPAIDWTNDPDLFENRTDEYRAAGFEPASVMLDQRVRQRMRDRNLDYATALTDLMTGNPT